MGREIKRVPLNFNWPLNTVWGGYLNPFWKQHTSCPQCDGSGCSKQYEALKDMWYGQSEFRPECRGSTPFKPEDAVIVAVAKRHIHHSPQFYGTSDLSLRVECERLCDVFNGSWCYHLNAEDVAALVNGGRLWDFTSEFVSGKGWVKKEPAVMPTPRQVNEWSISGMGHDAIDCSIVCKAEAERLGIKTECAYCGGAGGMWPSDEVEKQYKEWAQTEPPTGDGYQLWETVSEGSPISPVFTTPEELADWLVSSPDYRWKRNDAGTTREQWIKFIRGPGWAPSMVSYGNTLLTGVQAI